MGRELQKKKNRSSIPKKTRRRNPRIKVRPLGNALIAENWYLSPPHIKSFVKSTILTYLVSIRDKKQTLAQNYKRLGLVSRLNKRSGGTEKPLASIAAAAASKQAASSTKLAPGEARIERDEDGNVINIVYGKSAEEALNDDDNDEVEEGETKTDIVKALEEQASYTFKRERSQSEREKEWVEALVQKHGHDYSKMVWDRKLNPYQQSEGDIKRRIAKWEKSQKKDVVVE